jgi:hypothetical protein
MIDPPSINSDFETANVAALRAIMAYLGDLKKHAGVFTLSVIGIMPKFHLSES